MKKKIVFGITSLTLGGAERVLVDLANKLKDEYDVTIFTIYSKGQFEKELDKDINLVSIYDNSYKDMSASRKKIIPLYILSNGKSIYNKYIKGKYDIEIAFLEGPITRIFSHGNNSKIAWIHNDISKVFGESIKAKIKNSLDKKIYNKFDKIIFVSENNKESFNNFYNIKDTSKEEVIYNYIDSDKILKKSEDNIDTSIINTDCPSIITVSRLVQQKAIDRLIKVHKKLIDCGLMHNIYVIGEGPESEKLSNLIKEQNLEKTFHLLGAKENPYPYIKKVNYFALLSYFEGYGMVIDEAKILNKPIIITNTASKEGVKNYSKSIIVENNEEAIFEGLKQILTGNIVFNDENISYDNRLVLDNINKIIENL